MKKFLLRVLLLVFGLVVLGGGLLFSYPHLPAIVEEGFPAWKWPARGIYVQVTGEPTRWPDKSLTNGTPSGPANGKLLSLMQDSKTDALVAFKGGKMVYSYYRPDLSPDTQFNSYSMAKSLIGYLVLKAVDEGEIDSIDSPIGEYLIDLKDEGLRNLPIRKLLTMRSGLEFEEKKIPKPLAKDAKRGPDKNANNPFIPLAILHIEGLRGVEDKLKLPANPSSDYHYQNVNTALLGAMLTAIYKKPLNEILSEKIWMPAGASHARWRTYTNEGSVTAYCCLFATAVDWAKVGVYLANNGVPGKPFLAPERARMLTPAPYEKAALEKGVYGLHVRHDILDRKGETIQGPFTYFLGHGGQIVYLKPEDDLVVVRFGRRHILLHSTLYLLTQALSPH